MSTTKATIAAAMLLADKLHAELEVATNEFPEPCAPCPECPPQFPIEPHAASLAEVRNLFGHGGTYDSRPAWQAAMGRPSAVRSLWAAGASEDNHVTWWHNFVGDVQSDDGKTIYVVGLHPWPGQLAPPLTPPTNFYQRVAAELSRLSAAQRARVWVRFGWEPDGDWYVWSWRAKGQPFSEGRYAFYVKGWRAFDGALAAAPGVRLTLSATAGITQALAERALADVRPDAYTMDIYATWDRRTVASWLQRLTEQVETADRFLIPWGVDETSPYVDKLAWVSGVQKQVGGLDSKLSVELLHALVWFVQQQAGRGKAPLWVQLFERNSAEGKFAIVSVPAAATTATQYRAADGTLRYTTAPRTAQALVSLLGTPS